MVLLALLFQIIFAFVFGASESLYFICVTRLRVKEKAEVMRPARQRRMRILGNNPNAVPAWSENLTQIGGQVREAKGKILDKRYLCNANFSWLLDETLLFPQSLGKHASFYYRGKQNFGLQ